MATTPRHGKPYIYVTWITGILAGEQECRFAPYFKAHFKYDKRQDRHFDRAAWTADHTAMVAARASQLRIEGWEVSVESANQFSLVGETAVLAGKPDLVARKPGEALVIDCKTGTERASDWFQVLVYLFALPKRYPDLSVVRLSGEVCYRSGPIAIHAEELNLARRDDIVAAVRQAAAAVPPAKSPNRHDCAFCDIDTTDCAERWQDTEPVVTTTEF